MTLALFAALVATKVPVTVLAALAALAVVGIVAAGGANAEGDAGAGSLPDGSDAPPVDDPNADPDAAAAASSGQDDDDPDADDDDYSDVTFRDHPRFKSTLNKTRRLQRWKSKNAGLVERVRQLGGAEALDRLLLKAQQAEQLNDQLARNPSLRKLIDPGDAPDGDQKRPASSTRKKLVELMPQFDESHEATPFMRALAEAVDSLMERHDQTSGELRSFTTGLARERQEKDVSEFKGVVEASVKTLPKNLQGTFRAAVLGAKRHAIENGIRISNQAIVDHYLKELGVSRQQQQVASAAAASRIAQNNQKLPGRTAQVGGTPASPQRKRETVHELNRRLRAEGRFR